MATTKSAAGPSSKKQKVSKDSEILFEDYGGRSGDRMLTITRDGKTRWYSNDNEPSQSQKEALTRLLGGERIKYVPRTKVQRVSLTEQEMWREQALAACPELLSSLMLSLPQDGIEVMMTRAGELRHPVTALLAGVFMYPESRSMFDDFFDTANFQRPIQGGYREVVVGSGIHAAIYCAVRAKMGFPRPLVLEALDRAGGSFAVARKPAFNLNSRNRPGDLGVPGDLSGALNVLPGSMIQPSDLSAEEYISNDVLAYAIRATLAMYADVITGANVKPWSGAGSPTGVLFQRGGEDFVLSPGRVILALGLGEERRFLLHQRLFTFGDFMRRMDEPFPMRGMKKVAVIGNGDSAKTVIESLCGQGPQPGMSVCSLDHPIIDWYGPGADMTCAAWQAKNRTRFKGIGKLLRGDRNRSVPRVMTKKVATAVQPSFDSILVDGIPYTHVIDCRGYLGSQENRTKQLATVGQYMTDGFGRNLGLRSDNRFCYAIGPSTFLEGAPDEEVFLQQIGENSASIFRYAGRTATIAAQLPAA